MTRAYRSVVTGAGSGIGRAFSLALAARGGPVVLADVDEEGLARVAEEIRRAGGQAVARRVDVSALEEVEALCAFSREAQGETELLVNNAGVVAAGRVDELDIETWRRVTGVNYWGVIHGCHAFLPGMRRAGFGRVVNVASISGILNTGYTAPYNVTKAAVISLSETLAAEQTDFDFGVTALIPTAVSTPIFGRIEARSQAFAKAAELAAKGPGRSPEALVERALEALEEGRVHALVQWDARLLSRLKRADPLAVQRVFRALGRSGLIARWLG